MNWFCILISDAISSLSSLLELLQLLTMELVLQANYFLEQLLDLLVDILLDLLELLLLRVVEVTRVNLSSKCLTILQSCSHLVWQPSRNRCAARGPRVLGVVDDVLLDHEPVQVAESEGLVHRVQEQVG